MCVAVIPAFPQTYQATVSGVVTDAQGSSVPAATVTANNTATGVSTTVSTTDSGFYSMPNLPVGLYTLTFERQGFKRHVRERVILTTGETLGLDVHLEVGVVNEAITVSGAAPLLESRTSEIAQLIESRSIADLPLGDRRTMNVINLTGASVFVNYNPTGRATFSLAGGRTQSQGFWIDGGNGQNMRIGVGQMELDPPIAAVEEIQVLSNNYSAEYGGSAGGIIVETTKSGTNQFHGSLYEYIRNDKMDAPGFFAPIKDGSKVSPELRYNAFGGTFGGPIRHNKTFFFFAYEGRPRRTGSVQTVVAPTALQRTGDFSQTFSGGRLVAIYDPASTATANGVTTRTAFPGNVIPASKLDPVAMKAVQFYPLPNVAVNTAQGNIVTGLGANFIELKVDHNVREKDRLTGRYIHDSANSSFTSIYPDRAADPTGYTLTHVDIGYGSWTHVFSPTKVNDLRFGFDNRYSVAGTYGLDGNYPSKLGLQGVPPDAFPQFAAAGYSSLGSASQARPVFPIYQVQIVDNFSWFSGKHALRWGFDMRWCQDNETNKPTVSGAFTFATQATAMPGNTATGNGLASMLVGVPMTFAENETGPLVRSSTYWAAFVQDNWTVSPSLTLNLGLRWETDTPMTDANNHMNSFDPGQINPVSGTPGVVKFAGLNGFRRTPYDGDWNNFAPRFGFAWKPFRSANTVVRGGYGIFYAHPFDAGKPNVATLGFGTSLSITSPDNGLSFPFTLRQGVPAPPQKVLNDSFGAVPVGQTTTTAVTYFEPHRPTGYSHQFNLGIQHQFPGSMIIEASFVGNDGRKLPNSDLAINQIPPQILGPGRQSQAFRPFPQFSNVSIISPTIAISNYYAGMVRFVKRFSHGLNIVSSFTRSKFLDNSFEGSSTLGQSNGPYSNLYNRRADYGYSANDIPNRFTFGAVYELPFGPGKPWLSTSAWRRIVGGWSISNATVLQAGPPFTVIAQTNSTNAFSAGSLRPNVLRNPNLSNPIVSRWFDVTAFIQPPIYEFGNEGMGILRCAGTINLDFSLQRSFQIREKLNLQFRGEFFNAINHTNFNTPGTSFGSPTFGVVNSAGPARQIEVGAVIKF
jgi:hypothetical protein